MALVCESERDECAGVAGRGVGVEAQLGQVLQGVRDRVSSPVGSRCCVETRVSFLLSERFGHICTRKMVPGQPAPPPYLCGA